MIKKWILLASIALAVHAGIIQRRTIPVEVRYDDNPSLSASVPSLETDILDSNKLTPEHNSEKNLEEKVQLSKMQLEEIQDSAMMMRINPVRNLDEKIQLSQEEKLEAFKHLPVQADVESELVDIPVENKFAKLGEVKNVEESYSSLVQKSHNIVIEGIKALRERYVNLKSTVVPTPLQWDELEKSLNKYFEEEKERASNLKQQSQGPNIFQNIISNVQNITSGFVQNFQQQVSSVAQPGNGTQSDEQQPGVFGQFVNNFNNGVQTIQSSISNVFNPSQATTSNTNLSDSPTTPNSNIFTSFVNNVQQLFQGNQGASSGGNITQGDEGTGTPAPPNGPFQIISNVQGQIGTAFNNFVQTITPTTKAPGNLSDEAAPAPAPGGPFQGIQQVGNQIGSAINNFIGGVRPPAASGDDPTTSAPNIIQSFGQNVGQAFQNFISGGQNAIQQVTGGTQGSNNPIIAGAQQIGQQISTAVTGNPIQQIQGALGSGTNPIQQLQGALGTGSKKPEDEPGKEPVKEPAEEKPVKAEENKEKEKEKKEEIMMTAE